MNCDALSVPSPCQLLQLSSTQQSSSSAATLDRWAATMNVPEDNHDCPFHLWGVMFWTSVVWIIVGQPRFVFYATATVGVTLLIIIHVHFHGLNPLETVLMFFFIAIMSAFLVAQKYLEERRSRQQFEAMFALEEQRAEVHERTAQLHDFVKRITPEHLQKRRLSNISAGIVSMDIASEDTCVVLFVLCRVAATAPTEMVAASEKLVTFYAREIVLKNENSGSSSALLTRPNGVAKLCKFQTLSRSEGLLLCFFSFFSFSVLEIPRSTYVTHLVVGVKEGQVGRTPHRI